MPFFTLLLSGLPQHVSLQDLSSKLDRLFDTDDIRTFTLRDLPNHSKTNRRQIALDFASSFDGMIAQEKIEGYQYELDDGSQYALRAKVNKSEEYMRSDSRTPERCGNSWYGGYGEDWIALSLPSVDQQIYHRVNARLDNNCDESEPVSSSRRLRPSSAGHRSRSRDRQRRSRHRSFRSRDLPIDSPDERRSKSHCKLKSSPESCHRDRPSRNVHNRRSRDERRSRSVIRHRERSASRNRHRAVEYRQRSLKEKRSRERRSRERWSMSREKRLRQRSRSRPHKSASREPRSREKSRSRELYPPTPDESGVVVSEDAVRLAIGSFPNGSVGGLDGLSPQHLKDLTSTSLDNIKHEIVDAQEEHLQTLPDSTPRVTAITLLTSEAELFSIGRGDSLPIDNSSTFLSEGNRIKIKEEEEDAEDLLNDIQEDINNYKFWFA